MELPDRNVRVWVLLPEAKKPIHHASSSNPLKLVATFEESFNLELKEDLKAGTMLQIYIEPDSNYQARMIQLIADSINADSVPSASDPDIF